jgi:hypothetical protein
MIRMAYAVYLLLIMTAEMTLENSAEKRNAYNILVVGKYEGKRPLEELDVDGRIILKWIIYK